ncbi:hypothetical protein L208DRAFT_1319609 [Tricholoma matsutake]|nr:hypothetical protein L208DRAFT_1319609 [Tricholoma matsutake 945]
MSESISRPKQRLFVDVPPSPFPLSRYSSLSCKENAPLTSANLLFRKRKLSDPNASSISSTKKKKLIAGTPLKTGSIPALLTSAPSASADFPNGFTYCHQCSRKRDISAVIHCTKKEIITSKNKTATKELRCKVSLCRACLKNRYGEDLDTLIAQKSIGKDKEHVNTENYTFKCPKCHGICNCSRCRKSQGLELVGSLTGVARKAGAGSAAPYLAIGSNNIIVKAQGERAERRNNPKVKAASIKHATCSTPSTLQAQTFSKRIPVLKWIKIPVNFDLKEAEARFAIREFMMRFACIMETPIAKAHLMELEDIGGKCPEEEMAGWVSETCVRAIILGVLGLLAKQNDAKVCPVATAVKDIRATGTNLNKIWAILSKLCHTANPDSEHEVHFSIPDPLPPPTSTVMHNTRNMRSTRDSNGATSIHIVQSAQMIPVIEALIETAIHTDAIREQLESGVKDGKYLTKTVKDHCRKENEKLEAERKATKALLNDNDKMKEAQQPHLRHLENALKLVLPGFAPRFTSLGTDNEKRVFWALSPGIAERNAALDFITAVTSDSSGTERRNKKSRGATRRQTAGGEERDAVKQWSYLVAIWGKKPDHPKNLPQRLKRDAGDKDYDSEEDEDVEKWWAFSEPEEIRKLAEWVAIKSGVEPDDGLLGERCSSLVKGLKDYATLLEWRLLEDKFDAGGRAND